MKERALETQAFEILEQKVRKAVERIQTLREERATLEGRLLEAREEIESLRARLAEAPGEEAIRELEALRRERREVLGRVNRMLTLLDEAAAQAGEEDLLATANDIEA